MSADPTIAERDAAVLATEAAKRGHKVWFDKFCPEHGAVLATEAAKRGHALLATAWGDAATPESAEGLAAAHAHLDLILPISADFEHHPDIEERVARVTNRCVTTAISRGIATTRGEVAA